MAELAMQRDEEARASGWEDYLAWEESERQLNELQEKQDGNQQDRTGVH
jgi:hypothetical protein